jgi:hypothetical protein
VVGGPSRRSPFLDVPGAAPATRSDALIWLLWAGGGFIVGQLAGIVLAIVAAAIAGDGGQLQKIETMAEPPEWYVGVSLVGIWIGFVAGPWIACRVRGSGRFLTDLGIRIRPIDALGIVVGVGGQYLVTLLYAPFIHHLHNFTAPTRKLTGSSSGWGFVVIAVLTVAGAPIFEEIFFRGLLFKALARLFVPLDPRRRAGRAIGVVGAVVLDGLLFGLAHGEWEQLAGLAVFGAILAAISFRTGRLGMNIVSHASFNLFAVMEIVRARGGVVL